ncbi:MAG: hypothetical protein P8Z75_02720 [Gammaproteobacteria bacterium]|jgi:hypothetical protein
MIRMYSRKLLLPFIGVIQLAELGDVRALSLDGKGWAIHYALSHSARSQRQNQNTLSDSDYTLVATFQGNQLKTKPAYTYLQPDEAHAHIDMLCESLSTAQIPLAASDHFEYWLLDKEDEAPLALLQTAIYQEELARPAPHPIWQAMPASQLAIQTQDATPESTDDVYVPPINYRLEKLIEERAGANPKAVWIKRSEPAHDHFPPCLIREDWDNEAEQQLCDRYIERLAPRLLMMQGLSRSVRQRLEQAACKFVFDVERFYPLYPEVVDKHIMDSARVEAQLRRANQEPTTR